MKKTILCVLLAIALLCGTLTGCAELGKAIGDNVQSALNEASSEVESALREASSEVESALNEASSEVQSALREAACGTRNTTIRPSDGRRGVCSESGTIQAKKRKSA